MEKFDKIHATMEITEHGYLVPNAHIEQTRRQSCMAKLECPLEDSVDPTDPTDDHHYEPLPVMSRRKKGRTWRIFGETKRRSRSLGPSLGQMIRRTVASSELDLEDRRTSKSKTTKQKLKLTDIVIVSPDVGGEEAPQVGSYRTRRMSGSMPSPERSYSVDSEFFYERNSVGLASPLDRIPSIGSLAAAATLPRNREAQPALPPRRRYSEGLGLTPQQSLDDCALPSRTLSEPSPSSAVMEDELQLLRHRVEVLERRLAGELDQEDFQVLLDDRGESSTDDRTEQSRLQMAVSHSQSSETAGTFRRRRSSRYASRIKRYGNHQASDKSTVSVGSDFEPSPDPDKNHGAGTNVRFQRQESTVSDNVFVAEDSGPRMPSDLYTTPEKTHGNDTSKDSTNLQDPSRVKNLGSYKIERTSGVLVLNKVKENINPLHVDDYLSMSGVDSANRADNSFVSDTGGHPDDGSLTFLGKVSIVTPGETSTDSFSESTVTKDHRTRGRSVERIGASEFQDDYVKRTKSTPNMAMELPFGKANGTAKGSGAGPVPNGNMETSPLSPTGNKDMGDFINIRIKIADTDIQKSVCFRKDERIWNMKQHILQCPDVELTDSSNHGFYMLPQNNKAGKFLDEERLISDYPIDHKRAYLEFRYKKRVYRQLNLDVAQLKKFHTKSTLKQFLDHIRNRQVDKINKLVDKGLDPNYHEESTGETPLTIAVSMDRSEEVLKTLVNGGAHLDFRNRNGFTPVHRAVQKGNIKALDILLDLGASPNSKDDRGFSPLYYSIVTGSDTHVTELLLKDCAEVSPVDSQGWGLIHYACRYGRVRALKLLLLYGANISLVNEAGNTPLHVSALYNQEDCALMLMDRGADRGAKNKANQTPFQVAILANNFELAEVIRNHSGKILDSSQETPTFSKRRRWANYISHSQSLSQVSGQAFLDKRDDKYGPRSRMSLATIPGSPEKKAVVSNGSAGGASSPKNQKAPMIHRRIKEAPKGRYYIAKQNYSAQEVGELSLHKGDHVEVVAIGEYNYWQGRVAHSMGWFPSYCVDEISPKYRKSSSKLNLAEDVPISNSVPSFDGAEREQTSDPRIACVQRGKKGFGFVLRGAKSPQGGAVSFTPSKDFPALQYLEHVDKGSPADRAGLKMGDFILEINGEDVISAPHQYVVNLVVSSPDTIVIKVITVPNSKAYSWLKDGGTLRRPGNSPNLPISTPATKSIAISSQDQNSNNPVIPASTPASVRSVSISSQEQNAVDELDKAIDSATSTPKYVSPTSSRTPSIQEDEPKVASIRKRPIRHQVSQQHLEGIFQRQGSSSSETNINTMPDNAFVQKPTVPAPNTSKFNTVARMSNSKTPRQRSLDEYQREVHQREVHRRDSGGSDSAVSSLRSSPGSSNSYMTSSTMSVTDSAVHLKTERTASDPSLAVDMKNISPKSLQGTAKKPSPLPPTRSQSLLNLTLANSAANSPVMRRAGDDPRLPNDVPASTSMIAVDVHRSANDNDSSDDASSTSSFASAIALAAAKMEKKKETEEPKPEAPSAFQMAMNAKQNYVQVGTEGQNLNRNQNQNVENPSSTQVALQAAIAKRKQRLESVSENKASNIEDRIRMYKQQDKAARPKTGQAAFLDAIAKRRSIVESHSQSSEDDSSSDTPSSPLSRVPPTKVSHTAKKSPSNDSRPTSNQIADAASAMQEKIASRPPIKEDKSLNRHKNVIRVSPRSRNDDSTDSSDGETAPVSVKNLKQSFEKSKKLSPRDSKVLSLSPVREDETVVNAPIPPPPAFLEADSPKEVNSAEHSPKYDGLPYQTDIDVLPPPPSFIEDGDQAKFRREQPFDTASVVSSVSSISTMSSYSTMSTDPSSNDGFEPIGEETSHSNSNTLRSDVSSSGSSSSTLTLMSTGETNDNWIKPAPPVAAKPSRKSPVNDNDITNGVTNGNDNNYPSRTKSVSEWTVEDVSDWLDQIHLGEYKGSFLDNAISGEHLTSLGKDDLTELGVKRLGHRLTIIKALQKLQK